MTPETDPTQTDRQIEDIARGLDDETAKPAVAPKPSVRPTKIGERLALYGRGHQQGPISACRVAAFVSSQQEVADGKSHRVDVDTHDEAGKVSSRQHGVTVFEAMSTEERDALCDSYPPDKTLIWAERPPA